VPRAKNEKRLSRGYSPLSFWRKGGSTAAFHTSSDRIMDARGTTGDSSDSSFGGGGGSAGGAVCDSPVGSSRQSSADDADADNDDLQSEYVLRPAPLTLSRTRVRVSHRTRTTAARAAIESAGAAH
jgi:hypothetical protein